MYKGFTLHGFSTFLQIKTNDQNENSYHIFFKDFFLVSIWDFFTVHPLLKTCNVTAFYY